MMQEELNDDETSASDEPLEDVDESDSSYVSGQKKKVNAGTLGVLGLVLACGAVSYFLYTKNGPQSAGAATVDQATASATINEFLHGNGGNAKLMEQTLRDTQKVVQEFQSHSKKIQIPVEELSTNPFRLREQKPVTEAVEALPSRVREDEERQRIINEANVMELQSVVRGGRSACMLNNTLYHEGDQVGNFTIDEIRPKSVIVHQGKFRFELTMKR